MRQLRAHVDSHDVDQCNSLIATRQAACNGHYQPYLGSPNLAAFLRERRAGSFSKDADNYQMTDVAGRRTCQYLAQNPECRNAF